MATTFASPVVESGSDLLSSTSAEAFAALDGPDIADPTPEGADAPPVDDGVIETPSEPGIAPVTDEPPVDDLTPVDDQPPVDESPAPPAAQPPAEDYGDGVVKGKDRNGKEGLFVTPERWKTIYGAHQLQQKLAALIPEGVNFESLELRNNAFVAQERLFNDLNSADPASQGKVVSYLLDDMKLAQEQGLVGSDPAVPFAQSVYASLREKSPDGYAALRQQAASDFIEEMFQEAAQKGDESLFLSAQHFTRALLGMENNNLSVDALRAAASRAKVPYYTKAEMAGMKTGVDPVYQLRQENERLRAERDGRGASTQAEQYNQWKGTTNTAIGTSITAAVPTAIPEATMAAWKAFPNEFKQWVIDPLHREVDNALKSDAVFTGRIGQLHAQAKRAVSAQARENLNSQIVSLYSNRAKQAAEALSRPILASAAKALVGLNAQTRGRRDAAQARTAPRGTSAPVPRSIAPSNLVSTGENFDVATEVRRMAQLIG
jgi:hypothetical protein